MQSFLKNCINSVHDQAVAVEHIIMDGGSTDGTRNLLETNSFITWVSEKDNGMYDALNKGLSIAQGDIIGHLNADEQYLPGTLTYVINYFKEHPEVDYVVGDFLVIDREGELIAYRKAFQPYWPFFFSNYLYTFTCTLFYRRKVIEKIQYDSKLRSIADVDFFYKMQRHGFKGVHLKRFISAFVHTGQNLSVLPVSRKERIEYGKNNLPAWFGLVKPFLKAGFFSARVLNKTFSHKGQIEYEVYDATNAEKRKKFIVEKPTWKWL